MSGAHAAIVLAAGGSARLRQPKQLLQRGGCSLVARALCAVLATAPCRTLVMLGGHGAQVAAALAALSVRGYELHPVPDWRDGLSASLRAAARALHGHAGPVLVTGVDQPALEARHLRALLDGARSARSGCAALMHGRRPGAPALLSPELFARAAGLDGDRGFGAALAALPPTDLFALEAPALALDIDTVDDLRRARALGLVDDAACPRSAHAEHQPGDDDGADHRDTP